MTEDAKNFFVDLLLRRRTYVLEVFLALESLLVGAWVLYPGANAFSADILSLIPDPILATVMITHGSGSLMAIYYRDVDMCRRSALGSVAIWSFLLAIFAFAPPHTLLTVPLVAGLACAALWVYLRLYLRYPPRRGLA